MEKETKKVPVISIKDVTKAYYILGNMITRVTNAKKELDIDTTESINSVKRVMKYLEYTIDRLEQTNDIDDITSKYMIDLESITGGAHISWEEYFINIAVLSSLRSKDPKKKVGACIVSQDNRILSVGYNGFPNGCKDEDFPWTKSKDLYDSKLAYVVHAEANAILNFRGDRSQLEGSSIYVTLFPCNECAKFIIQSGIKHIYYLDPDKEDDPTVRASKRMLDAAGITYEQLIENT